MIPLAGAVTQESYVVVLFPSISDRNWFLGPIKRVLGLIKWAPKYSASCVLLRSGPWNTYCLIEAYKAVPGETR